MAFSLDSWTKELPTKLNEGQWFFVRHKDGSIYFREIRVERDSIYICRECNDGITKTSYGVSVDIFPKDSLEFCGPIQTPPGYRNKG